MPVEQELYGVLGDTEDTYRQLREQRNSNYLSRYPSFHASPLPGPSTAGASSSSAVPKSPRPQDNTGFQVKRPHRRRSGEAYLQPTEPVEDEEDDDDQEPEDTANKSWYDQDAEVWKPKNTVGKLTRRPPPPSRPQPTAPVHSSPSQPPPSSFPAGIVISEPAQKFARVKGPAKSAMKTPKPTVPHEPAPLPSTVYLSPQAADQRRYILKQQPAMVMSPPSTVLGSTLSSQGWQSPATTHGRLSSAPSSGNSHSRRGSSTGTSSVAFTNPSSLYSAPSQLSAASSVPPPHHYHRRPVDDGEPDENPGPRNTLFVVNADPETSESEQSPVQGTRPQYPPTTGPRGPVSRRKAKESGHGVPPVPPLPIQFKAPPPPDYPPPSDRSRSEPAVSGLSKSNSDRNRTKLGRHSSDNRPAANPSGSKPISIPPTSKHSSSKGALHRTGSGSSASSRSNTPYTPPEHGAVPISGADIPPEWIYPLPLTLEELFKGGKYTYRITTRMLSGVQRIQEVEVDVKPGWKSGTRIIFPNAGNERVPGKFQDMIFVVEQVHHERFARLDGGRLVLNQDIDLMDALRENVLREPRKVVGIDGNTIQFHPPNGVIRSGKETVVKGQGMWIRSKSQVVGRGDLIIRWNVVVPPNHPMTPDQVNRMREIFN